jgi:anti-sigma factor RsiW
VTHAADHLNDELLSAFIDDELEIGEREQVLPHLQHCPTCRERMDELQAVVALVRRLPELQPPRDFRIGPRLAADPPNVVRLRHWYIGARVAAASLAALFFVLSGGAVYVDSQTAPAASSQPRITSAAAPLATQPGSLSAQAPRAAAPAAGQAPALPASGAQSDEQLAAATRVNPLPTLTAAPRPAVSQPPAAGPVSNAATDAAAPLRYAALSAGALAILALGAALVMRRTLHRAAHYS